MSLWIRSQDKECLMKVERVDVAENNVIMANGFEIWLGAYRSEQRALEVLNEIQNKLTDKYLLQSNYCVPAEILETRKEYYQVINEAEFIITNNDFDVTPITVGTTVYEMPEE